MISEFDGTVEGDCRDANAQAEIAHLYGYEDHTHLGVPLKGRSVPNLQRTLS